MTKQYRMLFLDQFGEIGGGQRIALDLVSAFHERGWAITVLCPSGPLMQEMFGRGAHVQEITLPKMTSGRKSLMTYLRSWIVARRIVQSHWSLAESADLIVINGPRTLGIARQWVRSLRKPAVVYLHGLYGTFENIIFRSFLRLPRTAAIAASPLIAEPFSFLKNVHCIHNWVSKEFLMSPAAPDRLRSVLRITDRDPIILIPGRFSPNKGQLMALEASSLLYDVRCHFVFSGAVLFEERGRHVAEVLHQAALTQPQRIHVIDWQEPLPSLFDGADLVLVPSLWQEPFGLTAIEAMARARPLIVSDRGMLPRLADGGRVACVITPTPQAIADAIREFLAHREQWMERANLSREFVEQTFHPDVQRAAVLHVCASLLSA